MCWTTQVQYQPHMVEHISLLFTVLEFVSIHLTRTHSYCFQALVLVCYVVWSKAVFIVEPMIPRIFFFVHWPSSPVLCFWAHSLGSPTFPQSGELGGVCYLVALLGFPTLLPLSCNLEGEVGLNFIHEIGS